MALDTELFDEVNRWSPAIGCASLRPLHGARPSLKILRRDTCGDMLSSGADTSRSAHVFSVIRTVRVARFGIGGLCTTPRLAGLEPCAPGSLFRADSGTNSENGCTHLHFLYCQYFRIPRPGFHFDWHI